MSTTTTNPIAWVEIYVNDMPRAKKFYESVFQKILQPIPSPKEDLEMYAFPMQTDGKGSGSACALAKMEGVNVSSPGGVLIYFSCENCAEELSRIADSGGMVMHDKFSIGEFGFIGIAQDTEGNMIGLHSFA